MNKEQPVVNPAPDRTSDLPDSPHDTERLKSETTIIDMPEVKDIPGQEFIHMPNLGELADTTISSADEEGDAIWAEADDTLMGEELTDGSNADVTAEEKDTLSNTVSDLPTADNTNLRHDAVDQYDNEGEPLNETSTQSGHDLDTTVVDSDDAMGNIGEEDEENNLYSLGGDGDGKDLENSTNG